MIYIFVMKKISLTEDEYNTPKYTIKIDGEEKTKLGFMEAILSNFKEEKEWHDNDIEILLHIKSLAQLSDEEMMEIITEPLIDEKDETEIINGSKEVISWKNIKIPMSSLELRYFYIIVVNLSTTSINGRLYMVFYRSVLQYHLKYF